MGLTPFVPQVQSCLLDPIPDYMR